MEIGFQIKERYGSEYIKQRQEQTSKKVLSKFERIPNLVLLGNYYLPK
jgi:hypothetical protein